MYNMYMTSLKNMYSDASIVAPGYVYLSYVVNDRSHSCWKLLVLRSVDILVPVHVVWWFLLLFTLDKVIAE